MNYHIHIPHEHKRHMFHEQVKRHWQSLGTAIRYQDTLYNHLLVLQIPGYRPIRVANFFVLLYSLHIPCSPDHAEMYKNLASTRFYTDDA